MKRAVLLIIANVAYWLITTFIVSFFGAYLLGQGNGYYANLKVVRFICVAFLIVPFLYVFLRKKMKVDNKFVLMQIVITLILICITYTLKL